jgi:hypothetical protein
MVSEKHCNFLINTGTATAADIEGLGEEVRRRVLAATGITLEWEIRRIGLPVGKPEVVPDGARDVVPNGARDVVPNGARDVMPSGARDVLPNGVGGIRT